MKTFRVKDQIKSNYENISNQSNQQKRKTSLNEIIPRNNNEMNKEIKNIL
jgi:hypothetical protein